MRKNEKQASVEFKDVTGNKQSWRSTVQKFELPFLLVMLLMLLVVSFIVVSIFIGNCVSVAVSKAIDNQDKKNHSNMLTCSKVVVFTDGTAEGELNISTNITESAQATITINETGEVVYKSRLIKWLDGVHKDKLTVDLEPGRYECTVTLIGWDDDGFEWELATRDMVIVVQQ